MTVATLVIAVVGLVLSAVSVTWQVLQHRLSGPRVRVELLWGGIGGGRVVTGPIRGTLDSFAGGFPNSQAVEPIAAVRGRNIGRLPVDVTAFAVEFDGGHSVGFPGWNLNPTSPHTLKPGSAVVFYLPLNLVDATIRAGHDNLRSHGQIRGSLDLATGGDATSPWVTYPPR
jgi:hypothetical protein